MNRKLKALGLGVLTTMAVGTLTAIDARATVSGHFTSEANHVVIKGTQSFGTNHALTFGKAGSEATTCTHVFYHGTASGDAATTTQEVSLRPNYEECGTESGAWGIVKVHVPVECGTNVLKFTSRTLSAHGTVHLECRITITHPNCIITIPKQTPTGGIVYETTDELNRHAITANVTATNITGHFHGGICVFLGTTHSYSLQGSALFWGENTIGERTNITAT